MKLNFYQIDAFTEEIFRGNPACVVPLEAWLSDEIMLKIARENAVPETAFFVNNNNDSIELRWFTPEIEMDLCGHATLATAHVLFDILKYERQSIIFSTVSGILTVTNNEGLYSVDFPSRKAKVAKLPQNISSALNIQPIAVLKSRDYMLIYENEKQIHDIVIDRQFFDQINLDPGGLIVTARGEKADFVSRFFTPQSSILEDPVTGSAHCSLIPYWSEQLGKQDLLAIQLSERRGTLFCVNQGERVLISGKARTYASGTFWTI